MFMEMKKLSHIPLLIIASISCIFLLYSITPRRDQCWESRIAANIEQCLEKENIVPIVVIGSGCAGYSAAIYGTRGNQHTVLFAGDEIGGQLSRTTNVDNWPGLYHQMGPDIMEKLGNHAKELGAEIIHDTVVKVDFSSWPFRIETEQGHVLHALTCIIATGASPRLLGVPGEQEYWGKGVTTCAICDAPFYKDKDVIVIGGGDSAAEEALQLSSYARSITIFVRKDQMRASAQMQKRINEVPTISIVYNSEVKEIIGNGGHVAAVRVYNNKTHQESHKEISGVFLAIGHEPNVALFNKYLDLNEHNYIVLQGRTQKTNIPGVFAAGDVEDYMYRQAVGAAGAGMKAALDALAFLRDIGFTEVVAQKIAPNYFTKKKPKLVEPVVMQKPASSTPSVPSKVRMLSTITSVEEFDALIKSEQPVVVDFYTTYCPGCVKLMPILEEVAKTYSDRVIVVKCDAGKLSAIAGRYKILSVPTLLAFKNGQEIKRYEEGANKQLLQEFFKSIA